ncbi:MAG: hypothetical protein M1829_005274 [Trizodia sp. TS-e1964]|nr:MAG: hypothetical protein M1829_005274 [Trizodia sp. TS-e1964]
MQYRYSMENGELPNSGVPPLYPSRYHQTEGSSSSPRPYNHPAFRSFSLTDRTSHPHDLAFQYHYQSSIRSQPGPGLDLIQRRRLPFPYPTRLKRPGFRATSPAVSDFGGVDYRTRVGIDRRLSTRTTSPSYLFAQRRAESEYQLDLNLPIPPASRQDMPAAYGHRRQPSPHPTNPHSLNAWHSYGSSLIMPSNSRKSSSISRNSNVRVPSPLYYDYTEGFEETYSTPVTSPDESNSSSPTLISKKIIQEGLRNNGPGTRKGPTEGNSLEPAENPPPQASSGPKGPKILAGHDPIDIKAGLPSQNFQSSGSREKEASVSKYQNLKKKYPSNLSLLNSPERLQRSDSSGMPSGGNNPHLETQPIQRSLSREESSMNLSSSSFSFSQFLENPEYSEDDSTPSPSFFRGSFEPTRSSALSRPSWLLPSMDFSSPPLINTDLLYVDDSQRNKIEIISPISSHPNSSIGCETQAIQYNLANKPPIGVAGITQSSNTPEGIYSIDGFLLEGYQSPKNRASIASSRITASETLSCQVFGSLNDKHPTGTQVPPENRNGPNLYAIQKMLALAAPGDVENNTLTIPDTTSSIKTPTMGHSRPLSFDSLPTADTRDALSFNDEFKLSSPAPTVGTMLPAKLTLPTYPSTQSSPNDELSIATPSSASQRATFDKLQDEDSTAPQKQAYQHTSGIHTPPRFKLKLRQLPMDPNPTIADSSWAPWHATEHYSTERTRFQRSLVMEGPEQAHCFHERTPSGQLPPKVKMKVMRPSSSKTKGYSVRPTHNKEDDIANQPVPKVPDAFVSGCFGNAQSVCGNSTSGAAVASSAAYEESVNQIPIESLRRISTHEPAVRGHSTEMDLEQPISQSDPRSFFSDDSSQVRRKSNVRRRLSSLRARLPVHRPGWGSAEDTATIRKQRVSASINARSQRQDQPQTPRPLTSNSKEYTETVAMSNAEYKARKIAEKFKSWARRGKAKLQTVGAKKKARDVFLYNEV